MQFSGFEVTPQGNATLTVANGVLTVSGISNTGLDGVLIKIAGTNNYTVSFGQLGNIATNNGVLKCARLGKNAFGQVTTNHEMFKWFDAGSNSVITGYNATYLPPSYTVFGKLNGASVFNINNGLIGVSPDPDFPPPSYFWGIVIAVAAVVVTVWGTLYTHTSSSWTTNYDANGKFTGSSETITTDPVPFPIEVNGTTYIVDEYGIDYTSNLPLPLIGYPSIETNAIGELITGMNLGSFDITSIV